jgi:hypothetical protein
MSGASMGFMDEVGAAAGALPAMLPGGPGFSAEYNRLLQAQRQNEEVFKQNNPYLGTGLEVAGGLLMGGKPGGAVGPRGPVVPAGPTGLGRSVATAAGMGAAAGFGSGEGGFESRAAGAGVGAALGAGFAAAVPAVTRLGGGVFSRARQALGFGDSDEAAANLMLRALKDDGLTPRDAVERMTAWQREGAKPEALFDIAGENTRRLARTAAGRAGPGTDRAVSFLAERQGDQAGRVSEDAATGLRQSADDFHGRVQELFKTRSDNARDAYFDAWNIRVPGTLHEKLDPLIQRPIAQKAISRGLEIMQREGDAAYAASVRAGTPKPGLLFDPAEVGAVRAEDGGWMMQGRMQNLRLLDSFKRGLDAIVEDGRDSVTGRLRLTDETKPINDLRGELVGIMRDKFPKYAKALDAWGGPSQSLDAMSRGRSLFTMRDSEVVKATQDALRNPSDAEFFRLGAAQAIQDRLSKSADGADAYKAIFGSPAKRALLRASFPDADSFKVFEAAMRREAAMHRNAQFVSPRTGSQTQMRGDDAATFGERATEATMDAGLSILTGTAPGGAVRQVARNSLARAQGLTPEVADSVARRMFTSDPGAITRTLTELGSLGQKNALSYNLARQREADFARRLTTGALAAQ